VRSIRGFGYRWELADSTDAEPGSGAASTDIPD